MNGMLIVFRILQKICCTRQSMKQASFALVCIIFAENMLHSGKVEASFFYSCRCVCRKLMCK